MPNIPFTSKVKHFTDDIAYKHFLLCSENTYKLKHAHWLCSKG